MTRVRKFIDRPDIDYLAIVGLAAALVAVAHYAPKTMGALTGAAGAKDSWQAWTQTLAGVTASLLGLGVAAIAILFAVSPGSKLRFVFERVGLKLNRLLLVSVRSLAIATGLFALLVPFNPQGHELAFFVLLCCLLLFTALRLSRLIFLFGMLLDVFVKDLPGGAPVGSDASAE